MTSRHELFHSITADYQQAQCAAGSDDVGTAADLSNSNGLLIHYALANAAVEAVPETGGGTLALFESDDDMTYTAVDASFILGDNPADVDLTGSAVAAFEGTCSYIGYSRYVKFGEVGLTDGDVTVGYWFVEHSLRSAPDGTQTV